MNDFIKSSKVVVDKEKDLRKQLNRIEETLKPKGFKFDSYGNVEPIKK